MATDLTLLSTMEGQIVSDGEEGTWTFRGNEQGKRRQAPNAGRSPPVDDTPPE